MIKNYRKKSWRSLGRKSSSCIVTYDSYTFYLIHSVLKSRTVWCISQIFGHCWLQDAESHKGDWSIHKNLAIIHAFNIFPSNMHPKFIFIILHILFVNWKRLNIIRHVLCNCRQIISRSTILEQIFHLLDKVAWGQGPLWDHFWHAQGPH